MKELIQQYGPALVFVLVCLESIGLPVPGETVLVTAAIYAGTTHELNIAWIILGAIVGATLGSAIAFWVGQSYGYPLLLRYGPYVGLTESRIKIAQYVLRKRGVLVVLAARFVAVLRSMVGLVAGASRMPVADFMLANFGGAVAWPLLFGLIAFYLGEAVEKFARPVAIVVGIIAAAAIATTAIYLRRKERELAAAAERELPGQLRLEGRRKTSAAAAKLSD
jgi:membrane protein DedA with SNARE-associated domain